MATSHGVHSEKEGVLELARTLEGAECPRCGGFMVSEPILDAQYDGDSQYGARRCVQCGERIDPMILLNRERQLTGVLGPEPLVSSSGRRS
jgi:tRNA(Ile2) C34 agmatinyltransferase TiaS